jgi:ABC-2 type transport system ATP-binding protein
VLLRGRADPAALRRRVALVDTPVVAEPAPSLPVRTVVQEELRFATRPSRRRDAEALFPSLGLERWSRAPMLDLPPTDRVRLLLELAALREGVRALVLTSPERHGGRAAGWRRLAEEFTARGLPVLVIGGSAVPESRSAANATVPTGSLR